MAREIHTGYKIIIKHLIIDDETIFFHKHCLVPQDALNFVDTHYAVHFERLMNTEYQEYCGEQCANCFEKLYREQ